jgi:hypothetical protein
MTSGENFFKMRIFQSDYKALNRENNLKSHYSKSRKRNQHQYYQLKIKLSLEVRVDYQMNRIILSVRDLVITALIITMS